MKTNFIIMFLFGIASFYPQVSRGESLKVTFYPEGGVLVKGIKSMVAFKVTDETGENLQVFGAVKDASGNRVVMFASYDGGAGVFEITPQDGPYQAEINYAGKSYSVALPEIQQEGYGIDVDIISQVDDGMKYGRVYTPEQLERLYRLTGLNYCFSGADIQDALVGALPLRSIEWKWSLLNLKKNPDFWQGKYAPEWSEENYMSQDRYCDDDIKIRISRSVGIPEENVRVSVWKDRKELDYQVVRMHEKESRVKFLLKNLPEGRLEVRLSDRHERSVASRWVYVNHYAWMRSYREAKKQDIEMMVSGQAKSVPENACSVKQEGENVNVTFYPEGGTLLKDARSWITFCAEDNGKKPEDIYGVIKNEKGYPVTFFESYGDGLGLFSLLPDGGKYTAEVNCRGRSSSFELPVAPEEGFTLEVDCISHADDGLYGQTYTQEQKERILRISHWCGFRVDFLDHAQQPLPTVKEQIFEHGFAGQVEKGMQVVDAVRVLVRGRAKTDSLEVAFIQDGKSVISRKVKGGKQFMSRIFFPFYVLPDGVLDVTLSDSQGKVLVVRRIYKSTMDRKNYRLAKLHDLQVMMQPL